MTTRRRGCRTRRRLAVGVGVIPEVMAKQAEQYRDEAGRKLKLLTMIVSGGVYALIGILIIIVIIKLAYAVIIQPINDGLNAIP